MQKQKPLEMAINKTINESLIIKFKLFQFNTLLAKYAILSFINKS